ncbi:MAG: NADH-quinone oxidoreductase subunit L, partial [Ignavibacteriae bacterium]|nr:NADH-quinone oxidoreductase subunit L [Ignavibacteriota bacterium]
MAKYFIFIPILPLIGFLFNGLLGKKINSEKISGIIGSLFVFIPFLLAIIAFFDLYRLPPESRKIILNYFPWITTGTLTINYSFLVDPLSLVMVLVVTGVGFIIHVYSIGYMRGDKGFAKFFAFMNLFIFAMLNLVLADNFLLVFLGWEGVGLCSYLLIGFWYEKRFTGDAAKKAFIVNRIGDFGFMLAMFLVFMNYQTLDISAFLNNISGMFLNSPLLLAIALLFLLGATGKSAQIPLFVWLPDAMAGPTPVSALIHAATMVTAGVYLIVRCSVLYSLSPVASNVILIIGILTALISASIALKQNDIKKILAYSTISQLGFMFIALGTGVYWLAIFHLVTHAFFKALLFLGSGSVIHGMHEEQDITKMGGLKNKMKITYLTFFIGTLAISGVPPLSGFFSKDEILWKTFENTGLIYYIIVLFTAALTAFYMFRLVGLTFFGKPRYDVKHLEPHESPKIMTIPLIILAVLSVVGGFIGFPHYLGMPNALESWLEPVFRTANGINLAYNSHVSEHSVMLELIFVIISIVIATVSIYFAFNKFSVRETFKKEKRFGKILENKYYIDEIYETTIVKPIQVTSDKFLWNIFDVKIIDGAVNGIAKYFAKISLDWRKMQTGVIQDYATIAIAGIVLI